MGKNYKAAKAKIEAQKNEAGYGIEEAFKLVPETKVAKFDESVDIAVRLGVDPKQNDQMVRGTLILPNGTGKDVKVLVFAQGEKEAEAKAAGAEHVGGQDLIDKVASGWLDFDAIVATPDMMAAVSKLGKVLGPRGLMPNPKLGTVTFEVEKAVKDLKAGKVEYRVDKEGNVHVTIGRVSFGADKLKENFSALIGAIVKSKPTTSKGTYLKSLTISTTMGPGVSLNAAEVRTTYK